MKLKKFNIFINESKQITYDVNGAYADVEKINDNTWYITYIESKIKGSGTELINKIISDAKKENIKKIKLTAVEGSYTFFNRLGFEEIGENNNPNDRPMVLYI